MQSIARGLDDLSRDIQQLLKDAPDMQREMHEQLADILKREVDGNIGSSGVNDSSGRVSGWQQQRVGSGGGYAAISAISGSTGANSPGAITNYLENGHKIRTPKGGAKRLRRSRARRVYVNGFHFYKSAGASIEEPAIALAEDFAEEFRRRLEG